MLIQLAAFGQTDTIKIALQINDGVVSDPSRQLIVNFKSGNVNQSVKWYKDFIITNPMADSSEIIIIYQSKEIGRCFKFAPKSLSEISGLNIRIITSRKALKKKLKDASDMDSEKFGKLKSIFILTTIPKDGCSVVCTVKNWKQN